MGYSLIDVNINTIVCPSMTQDMLINLIPCIAVRVPGFITSTAKIFFILAVIEKHRRIWPATPKIKNM